MGKSYSYAVVVEPDEHLLINGSEYTAPQSVTDGHDDVLGWVLEQVRSAYASYYEQDSSSELTLMVHDRRPGGVKRHMKFTNPDEGIVLDAFRDVGQPATSAPEEGGQDQPEPEKVERERTQESVEAAPSTSEAAEKTSPPPPVAATPPPPTVTHDEAPGDDLPERTASAAPEDLAEEKAPQAAAVQAQVPAPASEPREAPEAAAPASPPPEQQPVQEPSGPVPVSDPPLDDALFGAQQQPEGEPAVEETPEPSKKKSRFLPSKKARKKAKGSDGIADRPRGEVEVEDEISREEQRAEKYGWVKLPRRQSNRPSVGDGDGEGDAYRKSSVVDEIRRQRWKQSAVIALVLVGGYVGYQVMSSGTAYEAYCVDQRTMTRVVSGVPCQDKEDTNHKWWYLSDENAVPAVGENIERAKGSFEKPSGTNDTVTKHVDQ